MDSGIVFDDLVPWFTGELLKILLWSYTFTNLTISLTFLGTILYSFIAFHFWFKLPFLLHELWDIFLASLSICFFLFLYVDFSVRYPSFK